MLLGVKAPWLVYLEAVDCVISRGNIVEMWLVGFGSYVTSSCPLVFVGRMCLEALDILCGFSF